MPEVHFLFQSSTDLFLFHLSMHCCGHVKDRKSAALTFGVESVSFLTLPVKIMFQNLCSNHTEIITKDRIGVGI